jgi:hypothetical protein
MRGTPDRRPYFPSIAIVLISAVSWACNSSPTGPSAGSVPPAFGFSLSLSPVDSAVKSQFAQLFNEMVYAPAVYNDPRSTDCSGAGHLTSTAYLRSSDGTSSLYYLYSSRDGQQVSKSAGPIHVITPAGHFKMLVAVIAWPGTVSSDALPFLQAAQTQINQDHVDFATSQGYASPIVSFESTNVLLDPGAVTNPQSAAGVTPALTAKGVQPGAFDFLAVLNIDPSKLEGGFSITTQMHPGFIYMGNFAAWTAPPTSKDYYSIAAAIYHHEVAHHWGWPADHDWSPTCSTKLGFEPLILAPVLFGWTDTDGDHVPEILDDTPYGRRVIGTTSGRPH